MSFRVKRAARILLPLFAFALFYSTAAAEVALKVQVGFHGIFRLGQSFPLRVELRNSGRPLEGTLEVEVPKGGPSRGVAVYSIFHRREIFLAAQSRKVVRFTVDPDSVARPLTVRFLGRGKAPSKEIDLRGHFSPSPLILLVTENSVAPSIPLPYESSAPVVSLSLDEMPSDAGAFQGVWAVLFYEQSLRDFSRSQKAALESWLLSGGRLLILGGLNYGLYQESSMGRFLPVRVLGLKRLASLPGLQERYGRGGPPLRNIMAQDSRFLEGKVLLEEGGTPIVVEAIRGRGRISYLSLDVGRPPLSRWEGLPSLLTDLMGAPPEKKNGGMGSAWNGSVFSRLLLNRPFLSARSPSLIFLLCLLIYGVGLLFWARLWQRQPLTRSVLAALFSLFILLIAVVGYLYFDRGARGPDGVLVVSTLMEGGPGGSVEIESNVGLFSTRRRDYSFEVERGWSDLEMVSSRSKGVDDTPVVMQDGRRSTTLRFPLKEWEYRLFRIRYLGSFPVRPEAETAGNRLSLKVSNLSGEGLQDCWLIISGEGLFLGEITAGASLVREVALTAEGRFADGQQTSTDLWQIPFHDRARELLLRHSVFPRDQGTGRWSKGSAYLVCWVQGDASRVSMHDPRVLVRDYTLYRAAFPLSAEDES